MKLNEFVNKYNGKKVDFDKAYGCQCVDLYRQYCKDVLDIPHTGSVEGAKDIFLRYDELPVEKKYFKLIPKPLVFIPIWDKPKEGDVAVWNSTENNKYGHVAIVLSTLGSDLIVFEQDGFRQDGAKINLRSKANMLGVLRI